MPSPRANLDLETWAKFKPQERANDFEYNILLYKFRSFYNEVKEFQDMHSNCSVTKALLGNNNNNNNSNNLNSGNSKSSPIAATISHFNNNSSSLENSTSLPPTSMNNKFSVPHNDNHSFVNGQKQFMNSNKKPIFQHQNSVPIVNTNSALYRQQQQQQQQQQQNYHASPPNQHYNSSYNLTSSNTMIGGQSSKSNTTNKPEIKQRGLVSGSKFLISKSSERLDVTNSNNIDLSCSLKNKDLATTKNNTDIPIARHSKYLEDDDNIYDAVSPDDIAQQVDNTDNSFSVASSIHNLNRLSLPQKTHLESSKSSLGLGNLSSADASRNISSYHGPKGMMIMNKSTPYRSKNISNEHSSNSFGSSILLDATNSSSSLSMLPGHSSSNNNSNEESPQYANYVNIDFFLKRGQSPSGDDLDEEEAANNSSLGEDDDDTDSEEESSDADTAQLSHSVSSDQLCDEALKNMSPKDIAKKLSTCHNKAYSLDNNQRPSSTSITPASSGDFLNDYNASNSIRPPVMHNNDEQPSNLNKLGSFFSGGKTNRETALNSPNQRKQVVPSGFKDTGNKSSTSQGTLNPIQEASRNANYKPQQQLSQQNSITEHSHNNSFREGGTGDNPAFVEAQNTMRSFLSDLNLSPVDDVFEDKAQRRIVKESFAVEFCGRRKLRHLFLFNDVIVCAKYQASSKQKFTFDVRWYLNLNGVSILDLSDLENQVKYDKEAIENQILAIRTNLMLLRGKMQQIKRSDHRQPSKVIKKLKKKRTELEAELVLLLPHLPLVIKHINGKKYTFFLSSNFDRTQWIESIKFLQSQLPVSKAIASSPSSSELQAWIQTCRKNLNPSLGTFLLRSNCDDDLLYGDLYTSLKNIKGITKDGQYYFCFEVDSYGHFSQKASSAVLQIDNQDHDLNEEYVFQLDGAHTLRILLYEELGQNMKPSVISKSHIELSRAWFLDKPVEKVVQFSPNLSLTIQLSYSSSELLSMRIPHSKLCPTFGLDITQVCKKEKTNVPLIIQLCVNEVERRGMREVGIYRMSGKSTDIQRLKKAFETNPYVAELLLRDIDVNSVTGFLKTYLREMPEGLFINKLYPKFVAAFNTPQSDTLERTKKMLELFHKIPVTNQQTIVYLVEHLVKIYRYENYNKMSLTNLATVLGPNILRPPTESSGSNSSDPFTAVVIGSMSQAGILYFFLNRKYSNLPLTELDSSELTKQATSGTTKKQS